ALGFEVAPSAANFLFVKHARVPGRDIFTALRAQGVIVRRWDMPRISDFLRISIGTDEQCDRLVAALSLVLSPE
ncbi:MAG: aminotransferase class I/II-fold pyridoxal phosphate-dependent enzyme, partial [Congregibacter sp.]|nr:aminotransferase class I/II-fold pyridoxal phosphate-dependent enzyme [Congregibacter sp.]